MDKKPLPFKPSQKLLAKFGLQTAPRGNRKSAWRPWSTRWPYLIFLAAVSLAWLLCIEALKRESRRNQGLAFYRSTEEIPYSVYFAYTFVPNIIAIVFSSLWLPLDLDIKRTEPYLEISKNSYFPFSRLFLDYSFESTLKIPYKALKRRHWAVTLASTTFILVSILLAPIQSALFGVEAIQRVSEVQIGSSSDGIQPLEDQRFLLNGETVNQRRSILTNHVAWPPFTTPEYAISRFQFRPSKSSIDESWSAPAQIYGAEPYCVPIDVFRPNDTTGFVVAMQSLDDDYANDPFETGIRDLQMEVLEKAGISKHCNITSTISIVDVPRGNSINSYASFFGEGPEGMSNDTYISTSGDCPDHSFVFTVLDYSILESLGDEQLITARETFLNDNGTTRSYSQRHFNGSLELHINYGDVINVTMVGFLCGIRYFQDTAQVSFDSNSAISEIHVDASENRRYLNRSELNIKQMEASIGLSQPIYTASDNASREFDPFQVFVQNNPTSLATILTSSMDGGSLPDSSHIQNLVEDLLRSTSSLNFAKILDHSTRINITASHSQSVLAIRMSSFFATASESVLGLSLLTCILLLVLLWNMETLLSNDPDSLVSLFAIIACYFTDLGNLRDLSLEWDRIQGKVLPQSFHSLVCEWTECKKGIRITRSEGKRQPDQSKLHYASGLPRQKAKKQFYLSMASMVSSCIILSATIVGSTVLLVFAFRTNFTYLADSTDLDGLLLWQFLPTLAATLLSAVWTVVLRDMSILEPWVNLYKGASASQSLSINYASRSPLVVLCKSLKSRHIFIAIISLMCVTTSLLGVVMGGWFSQSFVVEHRLSTLPAKYAPSIAPPPDNSIRSLQEAFDLVRTNVSEESPLPKWTSKERFFMPLDMVEIESDRDLVINTTTIGIGASLNCSLIGSYTYQLPHNESDTNLPSVWVWNVTEDGEAFFESDERVFVTPSDSLMSECSLPADLQRPGAINYFVYNNVVDIGCAERWVSFSRTMDEATINGVVCRPRVEANIFDITIDSSGVILSSRLREGARDEDLPNVADLDRVISEFNFAFNFADQGSNSDSFDLRGLLTTRIGLLSQPDGIADISVLASAASLFYAQVFSSYLAVNEHKMLTLGASNLVPTIISSRIATWKASIPAFVVSNLLFLAYMVAAIYVYFMRRDLVVPWMPKSLGSVLPWLIHSRIMKDFKDKEILDMTSDARDAYFRQSEKEYRFGWFRDEEGSWRLGVEESVYVEREWDPETVSPPAQHRAGEDDNG